MITREQIDNLHDDIEQWFDDYQQDVKIYGTDDIISEWYQQLKEVFEAAYGNFESTQ